MAYVFVNMAITLDGKIAGAFGEKRALGTEADRREMDRLRAGADVVLWGGATLRAAGHAARVRDPALISEREKSGLPPQPANAVITASGRIPRDLSWFEAGDIRRIIFTRPEGELAAREAARGRAEIIVPGEGEVGGEVSAQDVAAHLTGRGYERILLEGGGGVHWMFAEAGLVDTLHVTLTPLLAGGAGAPTLLDGEGFPASRFMRLALEEVRREGEEIFLRYGVKKKEEGGGAGAR